MYVNFHNNDDENYNNLKKERKVYILYICAKWQKVGATNISLMNCDFVTHLYNKP